MKWSVIDNSKYHIRYEKGEYVVDASMLDTGEWVIYYGEDTATILYTRNIYSRSDAVRETQSCIGDFTGAIYSEEMPPAE